MPEALAVRGLRLAISDHPGAGLHGQARRPTASPLPSSACRTRARWSTGSRSPNSPDLAAINSKGGFTAAEAWAWHRDLIARAGKRYDPRVVSRIMRGQDMSAADYLDLLDAREAWVAAVDHRIAGYDALIMPTTPIVAPAVADLQASDDAYYAANGLILRNPTLINFLDGCALSLPCHAAGTAPVGLMIAGSNGADRRILGIGLAVEDLFASR